MNLDCDVAVVGAGPAGSRTARDLARRGFRVLLLEEHRTVGVPSHCSGLISLRTLRESEIGEEAIMHRVTGAFVHTQSGSEVALGGGATRAVAIDRVAWDRTLAEQAQAVGAELVRARVVDVERLNSHVRLRTQTDGRDGAVTARLVVGADGTHSRVRRTLGMGAPREYAYNLGIEGRLKARRDDFVHVFVGRDMAPGWFGWIIPTGDGMVRAGIGSNNGVKPIECYRRLTAAFPDLFEGIEPCRMYGGTIPLEFAPRSYGDNVLLVGDAAGQVKPFSGGGIYTSLVAARHAAETAAAALEIGDLSARRLSVYEKRWKREIGRELVRSLRIRRFGLSLSEDEVERVVGTLRSDGLQSLAARYGDIDYPSRVLLRIARSAPALAMLAWVTLRKPAATWDLVRAHLPFA
ncbi:MAG TPA: NAD(P)/FAD-dependent oxidoreductase, partial [Dehalococcoidia bacterium]|nr:NAD(P)/FAD-dependent oxidoreductase [Dehalococcoidia bacterium]